MKLFCIPCAGASSTMYLRWRKLLPKHIEIKPVEPAGRGMRISDDYICDFNVEVDDLFTKYFNEIASTNEDYVVFGHSMGALLTYGLVRKIYQAGSNLPKAIIVSASAAPSARDAEKFQKLDNDSLIQELKNHNGTPEILFEHPELLDMTIQCLRSDYKTCNSFEYLKKDALSIPIHVFRGIDDDIKLDDLEAWQKETKLPITIDTFDGGHFYLQPDKSELIMITKLVEILSSYE